MQKAVGGSNGAFLFALLDLVLPDATRGEAVDLTVAAGIPSIAFTSELNPKTRDSIISRRAIDYISKLFHQEEFYRRIQQNIERSESIRRLEELNETKNRFIGIAAHDLRSPLSNFSSILAMFGDEYLEPLNDRQKEMLQIAQETSEMMLDLINQLLDVTAIESGKIETNLERSSLKELLSKQIGLFQAQASRKAVKIVARFDDKNYQIFEVADQGEGIPEEEMEKLYTPFSKSSTKPTAGESSHGLGLAIVKRLVELHGGEISVRSDHGEGSIFSVRIHPLTRSSVRSA